MTFLEVSREHFYRASHRRQGRGTPPYGLAEPQAALQLFTRPHHKNGRGKTCKCKTWWQVDQANLGGDAVPCPSPSRDTTLRLQESFQKPQLAGEGLALL